MKLISAESVTEGHPDKLADRISDSVLDAILMTDPMARVACETMLSKGLALVSGEISCQGYVDIQAIVRRAVSEVGYTKSTYGFDADYSAVLVAINEQSPDIAQGVNAATESSSGDAYDLVGAGDQGLMFGYATDETPELMPLPISLAHKLTQALAQLRKSQTLPYLRPDGKAQVTIAYEGDQPLFVKTVVISAQHDDEISLEQVRKDIEEHLIRKVIPETMLRDETVFFINPTGRFVIGGPQGDAGLTGRKIIVDTYGGAVPHGGGAFSGKDPTKVDRSAAYYARYIAKNLVAAGLAKRCQIQLAYAIGVARPVGMYIDSFGTGVMSDEALSKLVSTMFDARPAAIIEQLDLRRPIYTASSSYGHFGRAEFPWEKTDKVGLLNARA
ncbi:MAG: methionine adenosyltransferase [Trueperaceae bacterium]|nr:methionine adenosyltransferase [Trueperaceae bacterium]